MAPFVRRFADLLAASPKPLTIALSGSWGVGKTTVAEGLRAVFADRNNVPFCLLDLWSEDVGRLRRTLVVEVGAALRVGESRDVARKRVAEQLDAALRLAKTTVPPPDVQFTPTRLVEVLSNNKGMTAAVVLALALAFFLVSQYAEPFVGAFSTLVGALVTFIILSSGLLVTVTASSETQSPTEAVVETQRLFAEIVSQGGPDGPPVVIVVDNIDRLPPDDALVALREIRSLMEIKDSRCVFVVPVDRDALVQQLRRKLGSRRSARDYLDKFFNIDIALTDPSQVDLRAWARALAETMLGNAGLALQDFREVAQVAVLGAGGSPRAVRRILNGVSTRLRLLEASDRARLHVRQIALAEVLVDRFPGMAARLAAQPRQFVDLRTKLSADPSAAREVMRQWAGDQESADALTRFLTGTAEIALSDMDLQALLSLRSDRFWRGVGDATRIQPALEAGEAAALREIVVGLDEPARLIAIERALEWIRESHVESYTLFAFNGLNALAPIVEFARETLEQVRLVAMDLAETTGEAEVAIRLSPTSARLLLSEPPAEPRIAVIWMRLAKVAAKAGDEAVQTSAVALLRTLVAHASVAERESLQKSLAAQSPAVHAPLFEEPVEPTLVNKELGSRYATELAALELTPEVAPASKVAAARFALATAAGWTVPAQSAAVVERFAQQVPTLSSIGEDQRLVIERIVDATSATTGPQVDALVTALAAWGGGERHLTLSWALRYSASPQATQALKAQTEAWLASATPAAVSAYVASSNDAALARGIAGGPVLAKRWFDGEDELLEAAFGFEATPGTALRAVLGAGTPAAVLPRLPAASGVFKRRQHEAPEDLASLLGKHLAAVAIESVGTAVSVVEALAGDGWPLAPATPGLLERLANATVADLQGLYPLAEALVRRSPDSGPSVVNGYVNRCAIVGAVPLPALAWCAKTADLTMRPSLLGALTSAIAAGHYRAPELIAAIAEVRDVFQKNSAVRAALASWAALPATECSEVAALLKEAHYWHECFGDQLTEFNRMLDVIGKRCADPDVTTAVLSLRRVPLESETDASSRGDSIPGEP